MPIDVAARDLPAVRAVLTLEPDDARALLRRLRDECSTLVLLVRLENENRRAAAAAPQEKEHGL